MRIGDYHVKKNTVLLANQYTFKILVLLPMANNDSDALFVFKLLSGSKLMSRDTMKNIGSSFGSGKISQFASYPCFPDTASPSSKASKITGLNKPLSIFSTTLRSSTLFMMAPTFTRMAA